MRTTDTLVSKDNDGKVVVDSGARPARPCLSEWPLTRPFRTMPHSR